MIKPRLPRQPGDGGERRNNAGNGNAKQFHYMALLVMANLMRKDGLYFQLGELRDQCIEQNDFPKTSEPGEEGIGVARAFAAIHHLDAPAGKTRTSRQCKQALAQCSLWQRRKAVEERHDHRRRDE
jgi:hypothetical protein